MTPMKKQIMIAAALVTAGLSAQFLLDAPFPITIAMLHLAFLIPIRITDDPKLGEISR